MKWSRKAFLSLLFGIPLIGVLGFYLLFFSIPTSYTYFKPHAQTGRPMKKVCGGLAGPAVWMVFNYDHVYLRVRAYPLVISYGKPAECRLYDLEKRKCLETGYGVADLEDGIGFELMVFIPEGENVQFLSNEFIVIDRSTKPKHVYAQNEFLTFKKRMEDSDPYDHYGFERPLFGKKECSGFLEESNSGPMRNIFRETLGGYVDGREIGCKKQYITNFQVKGRGREFDLFVPILKVNGKVHQLPVIKFKQSTDWYLEPLNC